MWGDAFLMPSTACACCAAGVHASAPAEEKAPSVSQREQGASDAPAPASLRAAASASIGTQGGCQAGRAQMGENGGAGAASAAPENDNVAGPATSLRPLRYTSSGSEVLCRVPLRCFEKTEPADRYLGFAAEFATQLECGDERHESVASALQASLASGVNQLTGSPVVAVISGDIPEAALHDCASLEAWMLAEVRATHR